jgi:hypothetical protein
MSVFRPAVMRQKAPPTLATLHHQVWAVGAYWEADSKKDNPTRKPTLRMAVTRKRRPWFEGLWANAAEPVKLNPRPGNV